MRPQVLENARVGLCVGTLLLAGCASQTPTSQTTTGWDDSRLGMMRSCLAAPDRYGFKYSRRQVTDLSMYTPELIDSMYGHCAAVARAVARR